MKKILLNTAYFPPIQYLSKIKDYEEVIIEQYEHYGKQSYRNRCDIMTANGVMTLSVPVIKATSKKILTKETCIDYSTSWQKLHFKGIESAYKNSPYYDYYMDHFTSFFTKKEKYLLDLNTKIIHEILDILSLNNTIALSTDYVNTPDHCDDFRDVIHPKPSRRRFNDPFVAKPYHQTFAERFPFAPNLSVMDLLFNEGPDATLYL
ncbi:WbqC family protein [Gabonibacter chumensis]|uniref:WbqC family protein n=1 Tax=Gabonibacter chumensis TaxID=2972474 RepID=UPI0025731CB0|nr:WbqC family protein [Gabonibacter chumensis]MCR9013272.1 WbqC family protein [Gabonibacter chumensis]